MTKGFIGIVWMIVWVLLLIFVSFCLASFVAAFYILIYVFVPCVPPLKSVCDVLHRGVLLPYYCSDNFVNARSIVEGVQFIVDGTAP